MRKKLFRIFSLCLYLISLFLPVSVDVKGESIPACLYAHDEGMICQGAPGMSFFCHTKEDIAEVKREKAQLKTEQEKYPIVSAQSMHELCQRKSPYSRAGRNIPKNEISQFREQQRVWEICDFTEVTPNVVCRSKAPYSDLRQAIIDNTMSCYTDMETVKEWPTLTSQEIDATCSSKNEIRLDYGHLGIGFLIMGLMSFFYGGLIAYFANYLFFTAVSLSRDEPKGAFFLSIAAFLCGLYSYEVIPSNPHSPWRHATFAGGGVPGPPHIDHFSYGYYFWMASFVMFGLYCLLMIKAERTIDNQSPLLSKTVPI